MKSNGVSPSQLVPSYENCKKLSAEEWSTGYVWLGENFLGKADDTDRDGLGGPVVYSPAPTAEELLKAFNKLPLVKAPEIRYDSQSGKWQVWWENRKTNYMEHAEPSNSIVEAAYNAYIQVKEK